MEKASLDIQKTTLLKCGFSYNFFVGKDCKSAIGFVHSGSLIESYSFINFFTRVSFTVFILTK